MSAETLPTPKLDDLCARCGHDYRIHTAGVEGPCIACDDCPNFVQKIPPRLALRELCKCGHDNGKHSEREPHRCMATEIGGNLAPCIDGQKCSEFRPTGKLSVYGSSLYVPSITRCKTCGCDWSEHEADNASGTDTACSNRDGCQQFVSEAVTVI